MAEKTFKCPAEYNPNILEQMFNDVYSSFQEKNFQQVSGIPEASKGSNGEIWVDKAGDKFYIKVNGSWKTGTLA